MQDVARVKQLWGEALEANMSTADSLAEPITRAGERLVQCLLHDGKIIVCGHGASHANALHFSSLLLNHFEVERPPLPVINLNTELGLNSFVSDNQYSQVFSRQIQALGQEHDVLLMITTSGNSDSLINALYAANQKKIDTIALTGHDGGILANHLGPEDIELRTLCNQTARIHELHLFILHCFCDGIERALFGQVLG